MDHQTKPHVLVLGTYHMANNNLDVFNVQADDVREAKRQEEIREVVECLKKFKPTKVAVEVDVHQADDLQSEYKAYLAGDLELSRNEIHQIGYRVAAECNHENIYAVDWRQRFSYIGLGHVLDYAKEDQPDLYNQYMAYGEEELQSKQERLNKMTVKQVLNYLNDPQWSSRNHQTYMDMARMGKGDYYVGIEWIVNSWYRRNMTIFTNVSRMITSNDDRILVIFGVGHKYLLNQFFSESGLFHLEDAEDYLG